MITLLVAFATVPAVLFPLVLLRSPWIKYPAGRSLMLLGFVIAIAMSLALTRRLGWPAPLWVAGLAYGLIVVALWTQLIVLVWTQHKDRKSRGEGERVP